MRHRHEPSDASGSSFNSAQGRKAKFPLARGIFVSGVRTEGELRH